MTEELTTEKMEMLMVKAVDDVASPSEKEELMRYLMDHPVLRQEYDQHLAIKGTTDQLVARLEHDLVQDRHEEAPLTVIERGVGTTLLVGGGIILGGFGLSQLLLDPLVPLAVRVGVGAAAAGGGLLLAAVVRARLRVRPHDRYTDIVR